ncbi:diguanylate cyclase [Chitinimonas arctica]|uniref:diguanylate cyclase n=1 Tax=Chitinimonas arctica TaxID=2594795 RepID=A0A516SE68_9NEIS|nr:diguanylate cyclase [Chitinimonas arctica]QDQ26455.1 diguanylate cyclase [Chitinimonas arctica]
MSDYLLLPFAIGLLFLLWQNHRQSRALFEYRHRLALHHDDLSLPRSAGAIRDAPPGHGSDLLTGLADKAHCLARGHEAFELARRHKRPLSVLKIGLDDSRLLREQLGHEVGDAVLLRLARLLDITLRLGDLPARLEEAEFAALLLETPRARALEAAERIREAVENAPLTLENGVLVTFTVSIGAAELHDSHVDFSSLLGAADKALGRAWVSGRNRIEADNP